MYVFLFFYVQVLCLQAADISISIRGSAFSPTAVTVAVNDVITWTNFDDVSHNVELVSAPNGVAPFASPIFGKNGTFSYTVTVAGNYAYKCGPHPFMTATFSATDATTTPVVKPTLTLNALYPNPCIDYVHIETAQTIKTIDVYSEAGALLDTRSFSSNKVDLAVSKLEKGIYFLRIESADGLVETRRIVKN